MVVVVAEFEKVGSQKIPKWRRASVLEKGEHQVVLLMFWLPSCRYDPWSGFYVEYVDSIHFFSTSRGLEEWKLQLPMGWSGWFTLDVDVHIYHLKRIDGDRHFRWSWIKIIARKLLIICHLLVVALRHLLSLRYMYVIIKGLSFITRGALEIAPHA